LKETSLPINEEYPRVGSIQYFTILESSTSSISIPPEVDAIMTGLLVLLSKVIER
jgi:hypothetical protein